MAARRLLCGAKQPPYLKVDPRHDLVHARWRHARCERLQERQRGEFTTGAPLRPLAAEGRDQLTVGVLPQAFQGHRASGCRAHQPRQQVGIEIGGIIQAVFRLLRQEPLDLLKELIQEDI